MATAVFCIAASEAHAARMVNDLKVRGFRTDEISVLLHDRSGTHTFAHEHHTKSPEGAAIGAGTGGLLGGTVGLLAGLGGLAIPGVGPLIAAGPLLSALAGIAVGATVGGVAGALVGLGVPEFEAKIYAGKLDGGNVLMAVHAESEHRRQIARDVFEDAGATDIVTGSERDAVPAPPVEEDGGDVRQVGEIMSPNPIALDASCTVRDAARMMRDCDIGDVIVVKDGALYGIVTDRDLVIRALAADQLSWPSVLDMPLSEVASRNPAVVSPDDGVDRAVGLMRTRAVRRLPVVRNGAPVGIVSLGDLAHVRDRYSVLGQISDARPNH